MGHGGRDGGMESIVPQHVFHAGELARRLLLRLMVRCRVLLLVTLLV